MAIPGDRGTGSGRSFQTNANPHVVDNLYSYLKGQWRIERKVYDRKRGEEGDFGGSASFTDAGSGSGALNYHEEGYMDFAGQQLESSRDTIYAFPLGPSAAEVRFTDGKLFHLLELSDGLLRVEHHCEDDHYQGLFRAVDARIWLSVWRIDGPNKAQIVTSHYFRLDA